MNADDKNPIKFQSKSEIADCIRALIPFTPVANNPMLNDPYPFAIEKIKELTKLL